MKMAKHFFIAFAFMFVAMVWPVQGMDRVEQWKSIISRQEQQKAQMQNEKVQMQEEFDTARQESNDKIVALELQLKYTNSELSDREKQVKKMSETMAQVSKTLAEALNVGITGVMAKNMDVFMKKITHLMENQVDPSAQDKRVNAEVLNILNPVVGIINGCISPESNINPIPLPLGIAVMNNPGALFTDLNTKVTAVRTYDANCAAAESHRIRIETSWVAKKAFLWGVAGTTVLGCLFLFMLYHANKLHFGNVSLAH